ncbi:DUF4249 domain-containing protein [Mucilaginibacter ginsenosidivorans]|uniref:DUF4249 domain-containing protein n=1 Tax=Mucilaginibacter ginsenosidivorans TaxID=398053 RepID=A0A5B8USH4_9SPHI|nr:DUF4249 domain-containing protein [Mucilaginibacter ginsenosidivorans]QEC61386.1 DUF4249 domain-containing protein [Mucilaginibacter ginsenosidivorans]
MRKVIFISLTIITWFGCKKPYLGPAASSDTAATGFLVVEGTINTGADSTIIRVSRTVPLGSARRSEPVTDATMMVESDAGGSYGLPSYGNGYYKTVALNLSASNKYRLRVLTPDSKEYASDFVTVKNSPPIDSITYRLDNTGVKLYVNTHDPENKTTYYKWSYIETYIIHADYVSTVKLVHVPFDTVVLRSLDEYVYQCWKNDSSVNVILGSSAKLKEDVISQSQLTYVNTGDEKMRTRYSILVKQDALTAEGFNYWQNLKKNTEQLGSVFDAQPSELQGNIHCITNPSEPVIGYISAGSTSQLRIYIDNSELPTWPVPASECTEKGYLFHDHDSAGRPTTPVRDFIYTGQIFVTGVIQPPGSVILGYTGVEDRACADCTLRGSNKRPSFWIDR